MTGLLLSGCGYSVTRKAICRLKRYKIGTIENKTLEPKLQDKLHGALTEEFMKNGIMVSPYAETKISAVIQKFEMTVLSEKKEITIEYRILIMQTLSWRTRMEKKEFRKMDSPFIVSLASSEGPELHCLQRRTL